MAQLNAATRLVGHQLSLPVFDQVHMVAQAANVSVYLRDNRHPAPTFNAGMLNVYLNFVLSPAAGQAHDHHASKLR